MSQLETPVALIVFNQPDVTRRVFSAIAAARPERLLVIADAPRDGKAGEFERCEEVKQIVGNIDWPCKVETNFAEKNMGPGARIISGLDWVFSLVEEAIVLEHDCLPDPTFFPFCAEMLKRYRDRPQIGYITGFNPLERSFPFRYSYYFTSVSFLWGWATWRRAWEQYDRHLEDWPQVKQDGLLKLLFPDKNVVAYWSSAFDGMHDGTGPDTWDYQFTYTCWTRNLLGILPRRNLIQYIGFYPEAVHTTRRDPDLDLGSGPLSFPLVHPPAITAWPQHAMQAQRHFHARNLLRRVHRRLMMEFRLIQTSSRA